MRGQSTLCQAHAGIAGLGTWSGDSLAHPSPCSTPANLSCILGGVWMGKGRSLMSLMDRDKMVS